MKYGYLVTVRDQMAGDVGANESRTADEENLHDLIREYNCVPC